MLAPSRNTLGFVSRIAKGPLAPVVRPYAWSIPVVATLGLLAALLEGVGIGLIIPLASLFVAGGPPGLPEPLGSLLARTSGWDHQTRLVVLGSALIGFLLAKGVVQSVNAIFIANVDGRLARDIRNALSARVLALDYPTLLRQDRSRLVQIISTDCWKAAEAFRLVALIIPAVLALLVLAALLFWIDWALAAAVVAGACLIQSILFAVEARQRRHGRILASDNHALGERMLEVVLAMRVIRIFGRQDSEQEKFAAASDRTRRSDEKIRRLAATIVPVVDTLISTMLVTILLIGILMGTPGPSVIAFLVLLLRAQPHAQTISRSRLEIAALDGSVREVEWLLAQQTAGASVAGSVPVTAIDKPIRLAGVGYDYPDGKAALREITATIRPGVATALIGKSGAGKTTLINLLCRLTEPSAGAIYHGDDRLDTLMPEQWRARLAIAGQDVELLTATIGENIAYGAPWASQAEIEDAAVATGAHAFISALPNGYDTMLHLQSVNLSIGQRQRIGLARALVRKPDLLILDEATNAVDAISEAEIVRLLQEHRYFTTALVISHRQSTLQACQDCIVLDQGRLVEAGPLGEIEYYLEMA